MRVRSKKKACWNLWAGCVRGGAAACIQPRSRQLALEFGGHDRMPRILWYSVKKFFGILIYNEVADL